MIFCTCISMGNIMKEHFIVAQQFTRLTYWGEKYPTASQAERINTQCIWEQSEFYASIKFRLQNLNSYPSQNAVFCVMSGFWRILRKMNAMLGWFVPYFCFEHTSLSIGSKCVERPIECCCNACSVDFPANIVVYNETKRGILRWGICYVLYVYDVWRGRC